jgi:hypothetical protein
MSKFESKLVKALKFVSLNGAKNCKFEDKSVASLCNDVYLSHYVDEDIAISVDIAYLLKAIDMFGSSFSITQFVKNLQIGDSEFKISCENKNSGIDWFLYGDIRRCDECDETESIIKGIFWGTAEEVESYITSDNANRWYFNDDEWKNIRPEILQAIEKELK